IPTPADGAVRADEAADGTIVELTRGAKFVVALKANPTTGYDWKVIGELPSQLSVVGDSLESTAPAGVVGAGGTRVFTYRAEAAGTGALDLAYVRAWETGVPPERTFRLTVVVK
ncbi:MAG TPA: protease inhibitor I42 family protein, partial [Coriobacteriia bacterium]